MSVSAEVVLQPGSCYRCLSELDRNDQVEGLMESDDLMKYQKKS